MRVKQYAYSHSVEMPLNPRGVTTVPTRIVYARHATVSSTVHYPANYKIKNKPILFQAEFKKSVNKLFTLIIYYKLCKAPSYKTRRYYNAPFRKRKHLH
jgi:hypothetical protein